MKKENKTEVLSMRMTKSDVKLVRRLALKTCMTLSELFIHLAEIYEGQKNAPPF